MIEKIHFLDFLAGCKSLSSTNLITKFKNNSFNFEQLNGQLQKWAGLFGTVRGPKMYLARKLALRWGSAMWRVIITMNITLKWLPNMQILRSMTCKNTLIWSCPFFSELQFQNYENDTIASFLENGHTGAFRGDNCNSFYRLIFISRSTADF